MALSFEVKESDLLGRIGVISVGDKRVETPCLFPVIHPVHQSVSPADLAAMGFKGLMTNSLILYSRRREEALAKGIHALLGFDGMFMTDSGGYQVLEYGKVDVGYREIAEFQQTIGSNLAVTLDRPTGYSRSRKYAAETMEYSLGNALSTIRQFGGSATAWVGPVQGGLFHGLLQKSARGLMSGGFRYLALGSPTEVMESYRFAELVGMIAATRRVMPYSTPLHLFGAGHPLTMALSVALGCDTFDSASYVLFGRQGRYMTGRGVLKLEQMKYLPCSCPVCVKTSVRDLGEMDFQSRSRQLAIHNLYVLREEMEGCKQAIAEGRLWDLVEEKATAHPRLMEAMQRFAGESGGLADATPALKDRGLIVRGDMDLDRPELKSAAAMLGRALHKDRKRALLITGGEGLSVARLRVGPKKLDITKFDVYRLHQLLGAYPAELEFVYPLTQTVGPFSSAAWMDTAEARARRVLRRMGYSSVVVVAAGDSGSASLRAVRSRRRRRASSPCPPST